MDLPGQEALRFGHVLIRDAAFTDPCSKALLGPKLYTGGCQAALGTVATPIRALASGTS